VTMMIIICILSLCESAIAFHLLQIALLGEEALSGDLMGELSLISLPTIVFWMAIFSENFFKGSFLSSLSSSPGVY